MKTVLSGLTLCWALTGVLVSAGLGAETKPSVAADAVATKTETSQEPVKEIAETEGPQIEVKIPLFSPLFDKTPVAAVNDEPILLGDLKGTITSVHQQDIGGKTGGKKNYLGLLNRLVTTRLVLAEAGTMGLEELPDVKTKVDAYALDQLREMLKQSATKDLKPDDKLVEKFYKDAVLEWKIHSVKFDKKEDADALSKEVAGGGDFDALANKYIENGKAEGAKEGDFISPKKLQPGIAAVISQLKIGKVSAVIPVGPAFTILKLQDIRYPSDNAGAREEARKQALEIKRSDALTKYNAKIAKKYAVIDTKLLKKIDFEAAKPGFAKLLNDKRVLVRIRGEKPITVGDLALAVSKRFFHGVDDAIKKKEVNVQKTPVLTNLIYRVTFVKEAKSLGLDKSDEYEKAVKEFKDSQVFGQFVAKVIAPDITVPDSELSAYYQEHIKDFTNPAMVKVQGLIFQKKNQAESVIEKLRKGTDFDWVKNNAEGQVAKEQSEDLLAFSGSLLTLPSLPDGVREAVENAKIDDIKLYVSPEGYNYVLLVKNVVPPVQSPLESVRKGIFNRLFAEKINKKLDDWAAKLRSGYKVKIFLIGRDN